MKEGHRIDDPACYPVPLQCEGEIDWKVSLQSYDEENGFTITFNDKEFNVMPF